MWLWQIKTHQRGDPRVTQVSSQDQALRGKVAWPQEFRKLGKVSVSVGHQQKQHQGLLHILPSIVLLLSHCGNEDELSKEEFLGGVAKFPPTLVISQKKRSRSSRRKSCIRSCCLSTVPPGTSFQPLVSEWGRELSKQQFVTFEYLGGQRKSASQGPRGCQKSQDLESSQHLSCGNCILQLMGLLGLLQGRAGRKQEHRSQDPENTLICKHHRAFLPSALDHQK